MKKLIVDKAAKVLFKYYGEMYFRDVDEAAHFIRYNVQKDYMSPSWVEAVAGLSPNDDPRLGPMTELFYNDWRRIKELWDPRR